MTEKDRKDWFYDWFSSPYYAMLYRHRNDDEARFFIRSLLDKGTLMQGTEVLDLACGNGRHSRFLAEMGITVTGLDLSTEQIEEARAGSGEDITFHVGDMRDFSLGQKFDAVLNLFTSFGYFDTKAENLQVLMCVKRHLKPSGVLVLDYFNANVVIKALPATGSNECSGVNIHYHKYASGPMVVKDIEVRDGQCTHHFRERVQLLHLSDFSELLEEAGFKVLHTFGGYSLGPYNPEESDRLILIAQPK